MAILWDLPMLLYGIVLIWTALKADERELERSLKDWPDSVTILAVGLAWLVRKTRLLFPYRGSLLGVGIVVVVASIFLN